MRDIPALTGSVGGSASGANGIPSGIGTSILTSLVSIVSVGCILSITGSPCEISERRLASITLSLLSDVTGNSGKLLLLLLGSIKSFVFVLIDGVTLLAAAVLIV